MNADRFPRIDLVSSLEAWYASECDGDWEHQYGVRITTLDNPGWSVRVDLRETPLQDRSLVPQKTDRSEHDWVHWWVEGGVFRGVGGPRNLGEILRTFLVWSGAGSAGRG